MENRPRGIEKNEKVGKKMEKKVNQHAGEGEDRREFLRESRSDPQLSTLASRHKRKGRAGIFIGPS